MNIIAGILLGAVIAVTAASQSLRDRIAAHWRESLGDHPVWAAVGQGHFASVPHRISCALPGGRHDWHFGGTSGFMVRWSRSWLADAGFTRCGCTCGGRFGFCGHHVRLLSSLESLAALPDRCFALRMSEPEHRCTSVRRKSS